MSRSADNLVADYLRRLEAELSDLPSSARREVLAEITEHIAEMRAGAGESEAEIRELLDRVGDPADIAEDARDRFEIRPRRRSWVEVTALVLLPIGGVIIPVIGWFAGVILLWVSDAWSTRDKVLGTLVVPGGLLFPVYAFFSVGGSEFCSTSFDANGRELSRMCSGGPSTFDRIFWPVLVGAMVLATLAMTVYLARRIRRPPLHAAVS